MRLQEGEYAPLFHARDLQGRSVALANYYGGPTLIAFYRAAACPVCCLRLWHLLRRVTHLYQPTLQVIVLVDSAPAAAERYLPRFQSAIALIAEHDQGLADLAEAYGVRSSLVGAVRTRWKRREEYAKAKEVGLGSQSLREQRATFDGDWGRMPAEFLLWPDLRIALARYGTDAGDFLPFTVVDEFVNRFRM
jgi:peroxiredoxin Q/BCP